MSWRVIIYTVGGIITSHLRFKVGYNCVAASGIMFTFVLH